MMVPSSPIPFKETPITRTFYNSNNFMWSPACLNYGGLTVIQSEEVTKCMQVRRSVRQRPEDRLFVRYLDITIF